MLSVYVGEENFLRGVSIYLKKHLYANSVAEDLWMGIQEATGTYIADLVPIELSVHSKLCRPEHSGSDAQLDYKSNCFF